MPQTERIYYRTKDGRADYGFEFYTMPDGTERAYITSQPSYQGRDGGFHPTHRLSDSKGRYVCWDTPVRSREGMKQIAKLWADLSQDYIRTGKRFGPT